MSNNARKLKTFKLSIIAPFYNEEDMIEMFFSTMKPILNAVTHDWEIVCIDDGSIDATLEILKTYSEKDQRIKVLSFSRNFGKEAAMTAGLEYTTGDAVIPIDADLQDPPEIIPNMIAEWLRGYDVVIAQRGKRNDTFFKKYASDLYHIIISKLAQDTIPPRVGDYRVMDRKVVEVLKLIPEKTRYMKGIFAWVGFKTTKVIYERPKRAIGEAKQNFSNLWNLALDGIFSFSTVPLKIWVYIGLCISSFAFFFALYIIIKTLIMGVEWPGYASLMVVVLFMGGINLFSLGIVGEYIARIFKEVKNRPLFIISETYGISEKKQTTKGKTVPATKKKITKS